MKSQLLKLYFYVFTIVIFIEEKLYFVTSLNPTPTTLMENLYKYTSFFPTSVKIIPELPLGSEALML
ncbi:MAG: hypothetical protein Terrestrivirus1_341 [Terrestrivirus sp.]|uniref:Uncharacterized protein n=1 Tax=Terrestrivirus sp. TaxID=2487775 RepID=A0A3G4ZKW1_9VIRU|nr:MAG: hypothetical protein Terrestrivirus1_341 [Terrestrivirus sp.]